MAGEHVSSHCNCHSFSSWQLASHREDSPLWHGDKPPLTTGHSNVSESPWFRGARRCGYPKAEKSFSLSRSVSEEKGEVHFLQSEGDKGARANTFFLTIELCRHPPSPSSALWSIPLPSSGLRPTSFSSGQPCSLLRVYHLLPAHVQGKTGGGGWDTEGWWVLGQHSQTDY